MLLFNGRPLPPREFQNQDETRSGDPGQSPTCVYNDPLSVIHRSPVALPISFLSSRSSDRPRGINHSRQAVVAGSHNSNSVFYRPEARSHKVLIEFAESKPGIVRNIHQKVRAVAPQSPGEFRVRVFVADQHSEFQRLTIAVYLKDRLLFAGVERRVKRNELR